VTYLDSTRAESGSAIVPDLDVFMGGGGNKYRMGDRPQSRKLGIKRFSSQERDNEHGLHGPSYRGAHRRAP
jgi:hypothetical protein